MQNKQKNEILESYYRIGFELERIKKLIYANEYENENQTKLSDLEVNIDFEMRLFHEMDSLFKRSELYKF